MKLVSMIDFVLATGETSVNKISDWEVWTSIHDYAEFLNQPLNLGQFVPAIEVGGKWEVLEEPRGDSHDIYGQPIYDNYVSIQQFQQAKDKTLFKDCYIDDYGMLCVPYHIQDSYIQINLTSNKTINDLIKYAPTLTAKGQNDSGLK